MRSLQLFPSILYSYLLRLITLCLMCWAILSYWSIPKSSKGLDICYLKLLSGTVKSLHAFKTLALQYQCTCALSGTPHEQDEK